MYRTRQLFRSGVAAIAVIAGLAAVPAFAQTAADAAADEGDIIVTAQRRAEASRDVPITVTTITADQLDVANVETLGDTVRLTPGMRFDSQGPAVQPTIRGVGTAITTSGGGPNVGIYVDGFFQSNTYVADFQLTRVENIQVLKGPQGTLFGRNTTGGAILVTTAEPSTETAAEFRASYGSHNALTLQGYATTGLSDNIAVDIEGMYRRSDGFITNLLDGNDEIGATESWAVRLGVKFDFSDAVSLLLRYSHADASDPTTQLVNAFVDSDGGAGFLTQVSAAGRAVYGRQTSAGLPLVYFFAPAGTFATRPGEVVSNNRSTFDTNSDTVQATLTADLGFATLRSYSQYRHDLTPYFGDLDATTLGLFGIFVGVEDETWSQEFILSSNPGSRLQWVAGINYFSVRDTWDVDASFGNGPFFDFGGSSTTTSSIAGFVDLTYAVTDRLFLTAGGRYSNDRVSDAYFTTNPFTFSYLGPQGQVIPFTGAPGTRIPVDTLEDSSFTPRLVIRFEPNDQSSIYASFTRGYKAGILNVGGLSQQPVEPESNNAFEIGYKFDDRTLAIEVAGFYYDYTNLQVSSFQSGAAQIRNAASSEIYGLEGQIRYRASNAFTLYAGAAWTHARYRSFANAPYYSYCDPAAPNTSLLFCAPPALGGLGPGALVQSTINASGFEMQRSPEFTGNVGGAYRIDLGSGRLTLSGNLYYTSSFYFDPSQQFRQGGYEILAARAEWSDANDRFSIALYGDNLTNQRYRTQVLFNTLAISSVWSDGATWGIAARARF
jgi:iron complex outermembrane recepter protein